MERRAALRDVHRLAAEHRVHLLREPAFRRELPQKLERVVRDAMLRVVEIEAGRFRGQPLAARRIGVEEIPEMQALDFCAVPLQPAPDRRLCEGLSHAGLCAMASVERCVRARGIVVPEDRAPRDEQVGACLRAVPIVSGLMPPSTCTRVSSGRSARSRSIRSAASGMNA